MIKVDESIIGKTACVLKKSIVSSEVICEKSVITAYMAEQFGTRVRVKIRFQDGRWEYAENVFYPEDEEAEIKRFLSKYGVK